MNKIVSIRKILNAGIQYEHLTTSILIPRGTKIGNKEATKWRTPSLENTTLLFQRTFCSNNFFVLIACGPLYEFPTNNWRQRRIQHRFYAEIVTDITRRKSELQTQIGQHKKLHRKQKTE